MSSKPELSQAIKLLVDAGKDVVSASGSNASLAQKIFTFENMIPDALAVVQGIGDLKAEVAALSAQDIADLGGELVADLAFTDAKAQAVAQAALAVLVDASAKMVPDLIALLHAIKA